MDDLRCSATIFSPTPEPFIFLTRFSQELHGATDTAIVLESIVEAFSHITRSSCIALWSVNAQHGDYQRLRCMGSDCESLPSTLPGSLPLSETFPSIIGKFEQDVAGHSVCPEVAARLNGWLDACHSNVMVTLTCEGRVVGFCTLRMDNCGDLHDPAVASLLRLVAQMSANSLHRWLIKEDDRYLQTLLRRTDRLRSLEIAAGGFAHEIRNPLTSIKTFVQLAPERREDVRFIREFSRVAVQDIHRIEHLLQELFDYARYVDPVFTEEDVNELVFSCISFIAMKASGQSIQVRRQFADRLPLLLLDRQQIKQAVINLLLNALNAVQDHSRQILVRTFTSQRPDGINGVCVEVQDGKRIPAEHIDHIFDPVLTTQHSRIPGDVRVAGLTIAHQIIREHQGDLTVESREGFGSTFRLFLPIGVRHPSE